jgi:hypothetical protein
MAGIARSGRLKAVALLGALLLVATGCDYVSRVTVTSTGAQVQDISAVSGISATGRYSLLWSFSELVPGGHGEGHMDFYRRDNRTGAIVRVTVRSDGSPFEEAAQARAVALSDDGNLVALVVREKVNPSDPLTKAVLYVRNISAGTTTRASLAPDGSQVLVSDVATATFSTDGRTIAFSAGTYPDSYDIYIRDLMAGTTRVLPHQNNQSGGLLYSGDGQHIVIGFACLHSCFIPDQVIDLGATTYPYPAAGDPATTPGSWSSISDNGRYLSVSSARYDRTSGTLITVPPPVPLGVVAHLSGNGRFLAFTTTSTSRLPDPNAPNDNIRRPYLWDTASGAVRPLGVGSSGEQVNAAVTDDLRVARDGRYIAFSSSADNIVANDTNHEQDGFVVDGAVPAPTSAAPGRARGAAHRTVVVSGGFMLPNATADFGPGITVESQAALTHGAIQYVISIASNAAPGLRDVRITNPGVLGTAVGICHCFTVS